MVRIQSGPTSKVRRGVVLLVVISLLTLFAVVGLSFVLYANAAATTAQIHREGFATARPDVEPELLFSLFLGQLLYDAPDDATGVYSALRGHSLARSMYGLNYNVGDNPNVIAANNGVPFHGTGRLRTPSPIPGVDNEYFLINYTYHPGDGFLRDPERPGMRANLGLARQRYLGGFNAPYTYPDLNNMFLAAVKADGTVMQPSFHRHWLFNRGLPLNDALNNPNWTNAIGKYLTLRPRPIDMGPGFPMPEDAGGDVKNLVGAPGGNDSLWLDLDAPVLTAPDGRKYKALFAPLIVDLDNRVNLNVHGNVRGINNTHLSNQGWGPWEVNPAHLGDSTRQQEWGTLLTGSALPPNLGRYGAPLGMNPRPLWQPHFYAPVDYDGSFNGQPSEAPRLPGMLPAAPYQCFPFVTPGFGYGRWRDRPDELLNHPRQYNPFNPAAPHRTLPLSNLEALMRYGDTGSPALTSEIYRMCQLNFGDRTDPDAVRRRNLVTLHSCDMDRPGVMPFFWPVDYSKFASHSEFPVSRSIPFLLPRWRLNLLPNTEFGADWRTAATLTALRRMDLNRYLPPYPAPDASGIITDAQAFQAAQRARQIMAEELFERLWQLTGAGDPSNALLLPPPRSPGYDVTVHGPRWDTMRWLAQLAVNIVDFIDSDEYMTPFQWYGHNRWFPNGQWVYGTELPRLVLNEAYVQYDNHRGGMLQPTGTLPLRASAYAVNVWVELFNPLARDGSLSDGGNAVLHNGAYPIYQVVLCGPEPRMRDRNNVRGDPLNPRFGWTSPFCVADFASQGRAVVVAPSDGRYIDPSRTNQGFLVLGPEPTYLRDGATTPFPSTWWITDPNMTCRVEAGYVPQPSTILLRRLACPHRPLDENPLLPNGQPNLGFNPFVTVDYMEDVPPNHGHEFDAQGRNESFTPIAQRVSHGRKQPYAGHASQRHPQMPQPPLPDMPQNSFHQHNVDLTTPGPINYGQPPANYPAFDWLVHLDRPLVSPMELLQVPAYKPHELTHQFMTGNHPSQKFTHRAPWFDEDLKNNPTDSHRLYRLFEFVSTHSHIEGMNVAVNNLGLPLRGNIFSPVVFLNALSGRTRTGGTWSIEVGSSVVLNAGQAGREEVVRVTAVVPRPPFGSPYFVVQQPIRPQVGPVTITPNIMSDRLPGKINLNTVWDEETFVALCDPQSVNEFTVADAKDIFRKLTQARTPQGVPDRNDRPFLGMAVGNSCRPGEALYPPGGSVLFPTGSGLNETFFRSENGEGDAGQPRLLHAPSATHPYLQNQLLTKIFNNVTTRSNVFAVYLTVGFFEVTDDTTRPVKLGAEFNRRENRHVRHRMFAVVDRSVLLANPGPQLRFNPRAASSPGAPPGAQVVPYFSIIQ